MTAKIVDKGMLDRGMIERMLREFIPSSYHEYVERDEYALLIDCLHDYVLASSIEKQETQKKLRFAFDAFLDLVDILKEGRAC